jgi:hypothetical protein
LKDKPASFDERMLIYQLKEKGWSVDEINSAPEWIVAGCRFIAKQIHKHEKIETLKREHKRK